MTTRKLWAIAVLLIIVMMTGCKGPDRQSGGAGTSGGDASGGQQAGDTASGGVQPSGGADGTAATYTGLGLENLSQYGNTFQVKFTPEDTSIPPWTLKLDTVYGSEGATWYAFTLSGVSETQNLGDVKLLMRGESQYMTGPGVRNSFPTKCIIAPTYIDLSDSFVTPDELLLPEEVGSNLSEDGTDKVAGQAGTRYGLTAGSLGDFENVSGSIVTANEGGFVLRYDLTGRTVDQRFTGQAGTMTWHYEITSLQPATSLDVPAECAIPYPVMADATDIQWLGNLLSYLTPASRSAVLDFYTAELGAAGWTLVSDSAEDEEETEEPGTESEVVYEKGDTLLDIIIVDEEGGGAGVNISIE